MSDEAKGSTEAGASEHRHMVTALLVVATLIAFLAIFSIVTLTTVGYGDFSPTHPGTQIFTIVYILTGFGVLVALLTSVAQQYLKHKAQPGPARARLRARRHRDLPTEETGPP